ncbi:uncharacterized protein LOC125632394 [Caretta caretta]|uniref:uncharacterized protein LOC125632394 n=1 Tax=Caretta caretta TaxID=8467 RepID=UPI003F4C266B
MQSSSAQVTMMESQNRKRAPAWTEREVRDLIAVWGEESVLSELRSSFRNAKTFLKISQGMKDRGHNRDPKQCRVKLKELRQAYQKTREANSRSGSEPQTCRFYDELHAILGGSATTTPAVLFDSFNGDGGNTEVGFGDEEDDDEEEVVDSSQQASGETGFPDSQELFLTLDLEPVPPEPTQGCLLDPAGGEGTSAACVSMITGSSPSQRLVKLRKKKKRTRDEMFSELMLSSHTDRAQTNAWRQIMSECRKAQNDREERWRAEESKWRAEESKWRAEDRAEAQMWRQRDERRQDSMLRLLQDQTRHVLHVANDFDVISASNIATAILAITYSGDMLHAWTFEASSNVLMDRDFGVQGGDNRGGKYGVLREVVDVPDFLEEVFGFHNHWYPIIPASLARNL